MTRTTFYTATSLDGFIADENNSLDWLFVQDQEEKGPLNYDEFIARIGAIAMGSTTYEWVLRHMERTGESWAYQQPSWVMTTRDLPKIEGGDVRFARGEVRSLYPELVEAAGGKDIWVVGGGDLAGQFADAGLLDELIVYIAGVTLGAGAPLLPRKLDLRLVELERNKAFACARYEVVGPRS